MLWYYAKVGATLGTKPGTQMPKQSDDSCFQGKQEQ